MSQSLNQEWRAQSEDMDLLELCFLLWEQKWLILFFTGLFAGAALAVAYISPRIYETKATVLPPSLSDISSYNLGRGEAGLPEFKVSHVYGVFTRTLSSQALRQEFFANVYLPSLDEDSAQVPQDILWRNFSSMLVVSNPQPKINPDLFEVIARMDDPDRAAEWVNLYIEMAAKMSMQSMQKDALAEIDTKIQSIQKRIDVLRAGALRQRESRMARLREALVMAETIGIDTPPSAITVIQESAQDERQLYLRGTKAIKAELEVLSQRKSDDPFIEELYSLETSLAFLKSVDVDPDNVAVFTLDRAAEAPQLPVNMRKAFMLAIGIGLGGVVGLLIGLVRGLILRRLAAQPLRTAASQG